MTDLHEIDRCIIDVFGPEPDDAGYQRALAVTLARVDREIATADTRRPVRRLLGRGAGRRAVPRLAIVMVVVLVLLAAAAVAQPGSVREFFFGDDPAAPANRLDVLRQPEADEPAGSSGASKPNAAGALDALLGPPRQPGGDFEPLRTSMPTLTSRHPDRFGELLPLEDNLRLLLDDDLDGMRLQLVAVPTTTGSVCHWFWAPQVPTFFGHCVDVLDQTRPVDAARSTPPDGRTIVGGVVIDEVSSVWMRFADGSLDPATMGRNAFVWRGSPGETPVGITARFSDGRAVDLGVYGFVRD